MPTLEAIEQRLAAVELAVRELQGLIGSRALAPNWLDRVVGSMKDEPDFEEVLAYGRALRQSDRPEGNQP
jgi:hypothetical protein